MFYSLKHNKYLKTIFFFEVPKTVEDWKDIEKLFLQSWNFPRYCEVIDGKHVVIKRPPCSGSLYYNNKKTYSIILFAMVDADYCFTYIDIGGNGRVSNSAVFRDSTLNIAMQNKTIGFLITLLSSAMTLFL